MVSGDCFFSFRDKFINIWNCITCLCNTINHTLPRAPHVGPRANLAMDVKCKRRVPSEIEVLRYVGVCEAYESPCKG